VLYRVADFDAVGISRAGITLLEATAALIGPEMALCSRVAAFRVPPAFASVCASSA
jgi:hypothetical protein